MRHRFATTLLLLTFCGAGLASCANHSRRHPINTTREPENQVVQLQFAEADYVVAQITDLYGDEATMGDPHERFELRVDERTNSIIVRAQRPRLDQLVQLAAQLDIDVDGGVDSGAETD